MIFPTILLYFGLTPAQPPSILCVLLYGRRTSLPPRTTYLYFRPFFTMIFPTILLYFGLTPAQPPRIGYFFLCTTFMWNLGSFFIFNVGRLRKLLPPITLPPRSHERGILWPVIFNLGRLRKLLPPITLYLGCTLPLPPTIMPPRSHERGILWPDPCFIEPELPELHEYVLVYVGFDS